ncbi:MAG: hypothetical protein QOJ56_5666, partial [Mycobacterium sp.]|nr:hypothetical protein [Mycobacterium sp.]
MLFGLIRGARRRLKIPCRLVSYSAQPRQVTEVLRLRGAGKGRVRSCHDDFQGKP